MPERDCSKCTRQEIWGCEAKEYDRKGAGGMPALDLEGKVITVWHKPAKVALMVEGKPTYACPRQTLREQPKEWSRILMLYGMFNKGHLPDLGAVTHQSNQLMETFRVLDDANSAATDALSVKKTKGNPNPNAPRGAR